LIEPQATNKIPQSETFTTTWDPFNGAVTSNVADAPDGAATADGIVADAVATVHGLSQLHALTVATYTMSLYAKPGTLDWILLRYTLSDTFYSYFDVANGVVGTLGGDATAAGIDGPYLNGYYRCWFSFTALSSSQRFAIYAAEDDNDITFQGDESAVQTYIWGAQSELGSYPTSYIPTAAAAVTRVVDQLRYKADDGNLSGVGSEQQGALSVDVLYPNIDRVSSFYTLSINDGGSGDDRIDLWVDATGDVPVLDTRANGGNDGDIDGSIDIVDGTKHTIRLSWQTDNLELFVGGASEGTDTEADIPDGLDRIDIGADRIGASAFGGLIQNLRIFSTFRGT